MINRKKIVMLTLVTFLITMCSTSVMDKTVNAAATVTSEETCIVDRIAEGSDEIVGDGVAFDDTDSKSSEITPMFTSGGVNHTHQFLVARGMTILKNDKGISYFTNSIASVIMEYSDKPDDDDVGLAFASHFWDPDTNKNYLGQTTSTAKTRFLEYYNAAVQIYNTNRSRSYEYLGRALHYLSDIGEPHHASNKIAVLSNHSEFEKWVDERRTNYSISTANEYNFCVNNDLTTVLKNLGSFSKSYSDDVDDENNWNTVASATVGYTQEFVAGILYRYLVDVGEK